MFGTNEEYLRMQTEKCRRNDAIPDELFERNGAFRGLRDLNGNGVLAGLTNVSEIKAFEKKDGRKIPCEGKLTYRGTDVEDLMESLGDGFGFERTAYLLLIGEEPSEEDLRLFGETLADMRRLPKNFTRDVVMKAPTGDLMNNMTRSVLTLASYDRTALVRTPENALRQFMQMISEFPMLAAYGYHAYNHYEKRKSMFIHPPERSLSTAENLLRMLRPDKRYTHTEAKALDAALILHMEHGGGNNSTFTARVVASSGSDAYSTIAAAMSSLKGPRHGGANVKAFEMMKEIARNVKNPEDGNEVSEYLEKILEGEAFDGSGLIYGMGHAVYSLSDPREKILRKFALELAEEKGARRKAALYETVREEAIRLICRKRKIYKGVCPNVDFYSGFVYGMLGIPKELFTPLFATARIAGWSAHVMEEILGNGKIIRPAYMSVPEAAKTERRISEGSDGTY